MATVQITIPDAQVDRVLDAFAGAYGWTAESGLTKGEFARQQIISYMKQTVVGYEEQVRRIAAEQSATPAPDLT